MGVGGGPGTHLKLAVKLVKTSLTLTLVWNWFLSGLKRSFSNINQTLDISRRRVCQKGKMLLAQNTIGTYYMYALILRETVPVLDTVKDLSLVSPFCTLQRRTRCLCNVLQTSVVTCAKGMHHMDFAIFLAIAKRRIPTDTCVWLQKGIRQGIYFWSTCNAYNAR